MSDLAELCRLAVDAALGDESVEAYAEESRRTEVRARGGEVEGVTFAESRGVGVRVISEGRLGYAYVADPSASEIGEAVARARENAAFATPDEFNALPVGEAAEAMPELFRESQAGVPNDRKVSLALDLERVAITTDSRVRKVVGAEYGDTVSRIALASTAAVDAEYARTDCWCGVYALAEEGDETQTGFSYRLARELDELEWAGVAAEAATRASRMLGAVKPPTVKLPVVLDPFAGSSFLGVLSGALSAEAVQKGRSLFASFVGQLVGSDVFTLIDDGRLLAGPGASPFDDEGVPTERTPLISDGRLTGFLHNTYTARRGRAASTGNARRGGYRSVPGVGTTNLYVEPGGVDPEEILAQAEGGVLIQEVSGVHSGANPISGQFSVGATGLRITGGAIGEPLREMTIGSTVPEMLTAVAAVGNDLRFFTSVGVPTILIGEMTVAGV